MMIFASLLTMTGLIILTRASPVSITTYRKRDVPPSEGSQLDELSLNGPRFEPEQLLLYDQIALPNESPEIPTDADGYFRSIRRGRRSNSLSITNPIDVLRNYVFSEYARRQAAQNRRILQNIGKRSIHRPEDDFPRNPSQSLENNGKHRLYTNSRSNPSQREQHQQIYTQRIPVERTQDWYDVDDSFIRANGDDETRKMVSNEIRLL